MNGERLNRQASLRELDSVAEERQGERPGQFFSPCSKHVAEWRVDVSSGQIPPDPSQCPLCRDEQLAKRTLRHEVRELPHPLEVTGQRWDQELRAETWMERHRPDGYVVPGSEEERELVEQMNAAHEDAVEADRAPRGSSRFGQLVSARVEGGDYVEYRTVPGRRGVFARVTPSGVS
jgi:hypothetical protein